jgi:hypothetical protein
MRVFARLTLEKSTAKSAPIVTAQPGYPSLKRRCLDLIDHDNVVVERDPPFESR